MTTTSVRVILSARVAWAASKDTHVAEKLRTASIMERKSRVDNEICCSGGVVVLGPRESVGAEVRGAEGSEGTEDAGAVGNVAVIAGAGAEDTRI